LNLLKTFQTSQGATGRLFKVVGRCAAGFSKENCSSATCLLDFKIGQISPCKFSKLLVQLRDICSSFRSKGFEFAGFEKLSANSKDFWAERPGTY
jgi:hypothetical protein